MGYHFTIRRAGEKKFQQALYNAETDTIRLAVLRSLLVPFSVDKETFGGDDYLLTRKQILEVLGKFTSITGSLLSYAQHPEISTYPKKAPSIFAQNWALLARFENTPDFGFAEALRSAYADPECGSYEIQLLAN